MGPLNPEMCECGHPSSNHATDPPGHVVDGFETVSGRHHALLQDGQGPCRWRPKLDEVGRACSCRGFKPSGRTP